MRGLKRGRREFDRKVKISLNFGKGGKCLSARNALAVFLIERIYFGISNTL